MLTMATAHTQRLPGASFGGRKNLRAYLASGERRLLWFFNPKVWQWISAIKPHFAILIVCEDLTAFNPYPIKTLAITGYSGMVANQSLLKN